MNRLLILVAAFLASPAIAALNVGALSPDFSADASLGGSVYRYHLKDALKKGPVVLYFYPAAFTKGCTIEAHEFAEAMDKYAALGASVIGVSHDGIDILKQFSVSECGGKFPVAADPEHKISASYDAIMPGRIQYANRTSYVIAPNGTIIYEYTHLDPGKHVENTLNALRQWAAGRKQRQ